jgi:hypothetical protein
MGFFLHALWDAIPTNLLLVELEELDADVVKRHP